ncbi:hypothetical protein GcM3_193028 [Golovinomyces cichoracearum]|uniref:Uncharacterized protein n=1 Tax=Golovinomyces cichoracearum TaxID=62708 RepID=A0A420HGV9_9PEZI|nr:hypothetical protein GcM3_193028 [Golovinomyces cichoracearum]
MVTGVFKKLSLRAVFKHTLKLSTSVDQASKKLKRKNLGPGGESKKRRSKKIASKEYDNKDHEEVTSPELVQENGVSGNIAKSRTSTDTRMSVGKMKRLAKIGRAAYCSLTKIVSKSRTAAFTSLGHHIENLLLRGLTVNDKSVTTFYALIFDTSQHMERGSPNYRRVFLNGAVMT